MHITTLLQAQLAISLRKLSVVSFQLSEKIQIE